MYLDIDRYDLEMVLRYGYRWVLSEVRTRDSRVYVLMPRVDSSLSEHYKFVDYATLFKRLAVSIRKLNSPEDTI